MSMLINNCKKLTLFSAKLLRSSSVAAQIITRHSSYESRKFPGYHVVYKLDVIQTIGIINRTKRTASIIGGIIMVGSYGMQLMNILPLDVVNSANLGGLSIALFFHSVGYFCNNVVGFIYSKEGTKDVVISYVSYWGNRVDIETTADDIDFAEVTHRFLVSTYHTINIPSLKLKLKVSADGTVVDDKVFYKLFGMLL